MGLAALAAVALANPAVANSDGPRHLVPGSVGIFPAFDTRDGFDTIVTVTNTNADRRVHANNWRTGDVSVHFVFYDSETWLESDFDVPPTPSDTYTFLVSSEVFDSSQGWFLFEARDPEHPDCPIDFDYLIGSAILTNSGFNLDWEYAPYMFRGLPCQTAGQGLFGPFGYSGNGHAYIEPCDNLDGVLNFNGVEYDYFPRYIYIDEYFGEGTPPELPTATFSNRAYILSTEMEGTSLTILFYNNNERVFSRGASFDCWVGQPLSDFSNQALQENTRTGYNDDELNGIPYGWLRFDSREDPILGCFVQQIRRNALDFIAGDTMHFSGFREAFIERFN
jgi:hypothetical protein